MAGVVLVGLGFYYAAKPPAQYVDSADYTVTMKRGGSVITEGQTAGKWLNENEPVVVRARILCGCFFVLVISVETPVL